MKNSDLTKSTALRAAKKPISILLALTLIVNINAAAQHLELVGSCGTPPHVSSIYVNGDYAYIAQEDFGLRIVSISDPTNPVIVASYEMSQSDPTDVIARDDYAYLVGWGRFLDIIDVSDPTNPVYSASHSTLGNSYSIFLRGDYAYVGEYDHLEIFDVSDPTAPYQVGSYNYPGFPGELFGISVAGDYAYAASFGWGMCYYAWCSLDIFNVSNPHEPTLVSSLSFGGEGPTDVSVAGQYAYVCDLYSSSALHIIDIADPADPNIVGGWGGFDGSYDIFLSGPYAYLICYGWMVSMVNIADPTNPTTGPIYYVADTIPKDIFVVGEYVYVANYASLLILRFVNAPCQGTYIPGDCNSNGTPLELADVTAMIGLFRGNILPSHTCDCSPHGHIFAPQADPNGNCVAYELGDIVTEIGAYRGSAAVSGCEDCPPMD